MNFKEKIRRVWWWWFPPPSEGDFTAKVMKNQSGTGGSSGLKTVKVKIHPQRRERRKERDV